MQAGHQNHHKSSNPDSILPGRHSIAEQCGFQLVYHDRTSLNANVAYLFSFFWRRVKNILATNGNFSLTHGNQSDRSILFHQPQKQPYGPPARAVQRRIGRQQRPRIALRHRHEARLPLQIGDAKPW